jgi:RimJ/RimL family protein N-acetyltransferase
VNTSSPLITARLTLEPWRQSFERDLLRLASDPRVMRYIGDGNTWGPQKVTQRHHGLLQHWAGHGFGWRGIVARGRGHSDPLLGIAALNYLGDAVPGIEETAMEIGWWLDPSAWGRGIASEAAAAVRDNAFGCLRATRLVARCQVPNRASGRIAVKLGMRLTGEAAGKTGPIVRVYVMDRGSFQAP